MLSYSRVLSSLIHTKLFEVNITILFSGEETVTQGMRLFPSLLEVVTVSY